VNGGAGTDYEIFPEPVGMHRLIVPQKYKLGFRESQ
jgi:hypothetical protein